MRNKRIIYIIIDIILGIVFINLIVKGKFAICSFILLIQYLFSCYYYCKILHKYRKQENMC